MKADRTVELFGLLREIFGVCPRSGQFFRLSDCKIYQKTKPPADWMDKIDGRQASLDAVEERLEEEAESLRALARQKGRRQARVAAKRVDQIFTPRRLNPDDAKVLFHPVDYVVFNGMKDKARIKNVLFLDRKCIRRDLRIIQRSIERVVEREAYEWVTLRVSDHGHIKLE